MSLVPAVPSMGVAIQPAATAPADVAPAEGDAESPADGEGTEAEANPEGTEGADPEGTEGADPEGTEDGDVPEVAEPPPTEPAPITSSLAPVANIESDGESEIAPFLSEPEPVSKKKKDEDDEEPESVPRGIGLMAAGSTLTAGGLAMVIAGIATRNNAHTHLAVLLTANSDVDDLIAQQQLRARNGLIVSAIGGGVAAVGAPLLAIGIVRAVRYKKSKSKPKGKRASVLTPDLALGPYGASMGVNLRF